MHRGQTIRKEALNSGLGESKRVSTTPAFGSRATRAAQWQRPLRNSQRLAVASSKVQICLSTSPSGTVKTLHCRERVQVKSRCCCSFRIQKLLIRDRRYIQRAWPPTEVPQPLRQIASAVTTTTGGSCPDLDETSNLRWKEMMNESFQPGATYATVKHNQQLLYNIDSLVLTRARPSAPRPARVAMKRVQTASSTYQKASILRIH